MGMTRIEDGADIPADVERIADRDGDVFFRVDGEHWGWIDGYASEAEVRALKGKIVLA